MNDFSAVILADGDFPTHQIPLGILHQAQRLICCDGALLTLFKHQPQEIERLRAEGKLFGVGDGDSLPAGLKAQYADIFHAVSEQEDNDLTKATRFAIGLIKASTKENGENQQPRLAYLGATGKREDHTLGNIALMMRYRRDFAILPEMYTDYGWFTPANGNMVFSTFMRQQMSIFNFSCTKLESTGLRWQSYAYKNGGRARSTNALAVRSAFGPTATTWSTAPTTPSKPLYCVYPLLSRWRSTSNGA